MTIFGVVFAMPNKWTFDIPPIGAFVRRHTEGAVVILDPFSGHSEIGTLRNDIMTSGIESQVWLDSLMADYAGRVDVVLFDPPYSPRQIAEAYRGAGRIPGMEDTQNGRLYKEIRDGCNILLRPGGIALSFGWQSGGFGKSYEALEIMLVQHGGAHNDTICVAQRKPAAAQGRLF